MQEVDFFLRIAERRRAGVVGGIGTWVVLVAIVTGTPPGILFTTAASRMGLHRPPGLPWGDLLTVGCAAGVGFTVMLLFATAAFPGGPLSTRRRWAP